MYAKRRDYSVDTPNSSSMLVTDAVLCTCVFEPAGVKDDDDDAQADMGTGADTKVDSGKGQLQLQLQMTHG